MIKIINPQNGLELYSGENALIDELGNSFPIIKNIPRIAELHNYTENFGVQWNLFSATQIDKGSKQQSELRLFVETKWDLQDLTGKNILEVGSGAGRFSRVLLEKTNGNLWSVDYSSAVEANNSNNHAIAPERFHLFQASIYEMPFPDNSFDKVLCLGVLQHTPDFEKSVASLIGKAALDGEIVVDFYPINGWWTKLHAKYLLRPITKRMGHEKLLKFIGNNVDWMISASRFLHKIKLGVLSRFLPVVDINTIPSELSDSEFREWVLLDTFDMFSPEYDTPQRIDAVARMFEKYGARVTFSGNEYFSGVSSAVVRGVKM